MKKNIYALILSLVVVSGLAFANREFKNELFRKSTPKPGAAAGNEAAMKKWGLTPDGIKYKKWETSPEGKKVFTGAANIRKNIREYTNMEGVVTSLSLQPGSSLGFGIMVKINNLDYILAFGPEDANNSFLNFNNDFRQLYSLKINDKIIIRSHSISYAPKYSYPIITGEYVEQNNKVIYARATRKSGC